MMGSNTLFAWGRKRIALITVKQAPFIENKRENGYRQALCDAGIEIDQNLIFTAIILTTAAATPRKRLLKVGLRRTVFSVFAI